MPLDASRNRKTDKGERNKEKSNPNPVKSLAIGGGTRMDAANTSPITETGRTLLGTCLLELRNPPVHQTTIGHPPTKELRRNLNLPTRIMMEKSQTKRKPLGHEICSDQGL